MSDTPCCRDSHSSPPIPPWSPNPRPFHRNACSSSGGPPAVAPGGCTHPDCSRVCARADDLPVCAGLGSGPNRFWNRHGAVEQAAPPLPARRICRQLIENGTEAAGDRPVLSYNWNGKNYQGAIHGTMGIVYYM